MLVSHSHQEQTSLWTVYGDLSDYLIKSLAKQLFSNVTYPFSPGLPVFQGRIQRFFELNDIVSFRFLM